jgi:hypothetical protein
MKAVCFFLFLSCIPAYAQDPAMDAMQQNLQAGQQASQQATQQAIEQMQQASQQALQQANMMTFPDTGPVIGFTHRPVFSLKPGAVAAGTTVRLKCPTHYAVIFYTTNGWTPTPHSRRYVGPIVIDATTRLQAIAFAPNMGRSPIARADYIVKGSTATIQPISLPVDDLLASGTRIHLATAATVNSKTAQIGDLVDLVLNQDIRAGNAVLVPKGTPVLATIIVADRAAHGLPGDLAFEVHSLTVHGTLVPLQGGETLEGLSRFDREDNDQIDIPGRGPAAKAIRHGEALIQPGMTFTAAVAKDTRLQP